MGGKGKGSLDAHLILCFCVVVFFPVFNLIIVPNFYLYGVLQFSATWSHSALFLGIFFHKDFLITG